MKMYEVEVKCGHVGKGKYVNKVLPIMAENGKEAAAIARNTPRVKHDHTDAIRRVDEIDGERYGRLVQAKKDDLYFHCHNIQQQRRWCVIDAMDEDVPEQYGRKDGQGTPVYIGKQRIRNPKKYVNRYTYERNVG